MSTTGQSSSRHEHKSTYITRIMEDFSRALHDIEHIKPNQSQANNLYTQSGLEEQKFVDLMYEAKKRAQWAALAASSTSPEAPNRAAYFFTTLKNLVTAPSAYAVRFSGTIPDSSAHESE